MTLKELMHIHLFYEAEVPVFN